MSGSLGVPRTLFSRAGTYIGWVGHQNLGDEVLWERCRQRFADIHWSVFHDLTWPGSFLEGLREATRPRRALLRIVGEEMRSGPRLRRVVNRAVHRAAAYRGGEIGLLGGGTLINLSDVWLDAYGQVRRRTNALVPVFGTGVASPEFWSTHQPGWQDRRKDWISLLNDLPIIGVRGPLSKSLLEEAGARNVVVSGDPAVQFHSPLESSDQARPLDRPLRVGINCGISSLPFWGNPASVHEVLAGVAQELIRLGYQVELVAVWPEDLNWCYRVAQQARLPASVVAPALTTAKSFLKKTHSLDLLIALKLHAAILSAAANLPCIVLEYQPKCLDFAASIGWQQFAIRTSHVTVPKVLDMLSAMMSNLPLLRADLCREMCKISSQFDQYCRAIEPLLRHRDPFPGQENP